MPAYRQVAENYNRNIAHLTRVWSAATVEVAWQEDGRRRHEQGEGNFIAVFPDRLALRMSKVGNTLLWAGCDPDRYWFFDLSSSPTTVSFGHHANLGKPGTRPLPMPIPPLQVPRLLGTVPLDPAVIPPPLVGWSREEGAFIVEPPGTASRLFIEPGTFHAQRIELLDARGQVVLIGKLSEYIQVETANMARGDWPWLAGLLQVDAPADQSQLRLHLSTVSDGVQFNQIRPDVFDFDRLLQALKPEQQINLDPPPPTPPEKR
jgi:hypothetical protein